MARIFLDGRVTLYPGDCRTVLAELPEASVDSVVTDPPYGIRFMGKAWDGADIDRVVEQKRRKNTTRTNGGRDDGAAFAAGAYDFSLTSNQKFQAWTHLWATEILRVLKPGGHLVAFSGTRTYHRMVCAIEDAGFEVRDQIGWAYGSGFPKSHDVSKGIDRAAGAEREVTAPPPYRRGRAQQAYSETRRVSHDYPVQSITAPATEAAKQWNGYGTALKPAWEPIVLARRPLIGTIAENVLKHGTGALNIDGCRIEATDGKSARVGHSCKESPVHVFGPKRMHAEPDGLGRWPANIVHDGSEEVLAAFPERDGATSNGKSGVNEIYGGGWGPQPQLPGYADNGSAARFFYTAKADSEDRLGSKHPTVKPLDLMQWLVRLVTPRGGVCLDPFAGTGTTGEAAWREGMRAILIERQEEYLADIERRMELAANPTKRAAVAKTKNNLDRPEDLPLFQTLRDT